MEEIDVVTARRLALARAGLAPTEWTGLPATARGAGPTARAAAHGVIARFGYLQLDTISVAGARSHALVLLSRLRGMDPALGERLLVPGAPLFEYFGHEASWMPVEMWPLFAFRRERFRHRPWWRGIIEPHRAVADAILRRARDEGPFRSSDLEGASDRGWWLARSANRIAAALWASGDLAIRERRAFQRIYDLPERVIPEDVRSTQVSVADAHRDLVLLAFDGHGWADARTVAATFRLLPRSEPFLGAMRSLADEGAIVPCALVEDDGHRRAGWIRPRDLDSAARLARWRPRKDRGVLLSPFDPLVWDRGRALRLFGFHYRIEIYTPAAKRRFGYFSMPVLAGERLVARVDVKADRAAGVVRALACHYEAGVPARRAPAADREAVRTAVGRHAAALGLGTR
jgi:uncharacterized protein